MEATEREYRILKLGLTLKKLMEASGLNGSQVSYENISSFRKFETSTGIGHPSLVKIVNGEKNAAWSTVDAILEGLGMTLSKFGSYYDALTAEEIEAHKNAIQQKRLEREKQQNTDKKKKPVKHRKATPKKTTGKKKKSNTATNKK